MILIIEGIGTEYSATKSTLQHKSMEYTVLIQRDMSNIRIQILILPNLQKHMRALTPASVRAYTHTYTHTTYTLTHLLT